MLLTDWIPYIPDEYEFIFGIAALFGFTLLFTIITYKDIRAFFIWMFVVNGFLVWGAILEPWTLILTLSVGLAIIAYLTKRN